MSADTPKTSTTPASGALRIAVVEDDAEFRDEILLPILSRSGFQPVGMGSALELYRALLADRYHLVLLDVNLPDEDGLAIARHLRALSQSLGIVMLTGHASAESRRRALECGVDAYLSKPADLQELVATLRNLGRRVATVVPDQADGGSGWRLDERGWRILSPDGRELGLSLAERQVLALLADNPGAPVSREALLARLSGPAENFDPRRLEMLVYRLRRKCRQELGQELPLKAVRGVGYMLAW